MAKAAANYKAYDYKKAYDAALAAQKQAEQAAYETKMGELRQKSAQAKAEYDATRGDIYQNARVSAIGNNEALAANGLAGGLYDAPKSGYSETSRVRENIALRNNLNAATLQEQSLEDQIAQDMIAAGYTKDQNIANYLAKLELERAQTEGQQMQDKNEYDLAAWKAALEAERYQTDLAQEKQKLLLDQALKEVSTFGKIMTNQTAKVLGLPIGTMSYDTKLQQAAQAAKSAKSRRRRTSKKSNASTSLGWNIPMQTSASKTKRKFNTLNEVYGD